MGNMGMADSEYHEKMMRLGQKRDVIPARRPKHNHLTRVIKSPGRCPACDEQHHGIVPARRPEDDALDRLYVMADRAAGKDVRAVDLAAITTVSKELEQLREELRVITNERDELYEANWPWEWVIATREKERRQAAEAEADKYRKATDQQARRAEAAEAEAQRYREGLREATDWMHANGLAPSWVAKARALLSASTTDGGGAK